MKQKHDSFVVPAVAYWSHIKEPNNKGEYPSGKYEMVLGQLSPASISKFQGAGLGKYIKNKGDEQGSFAKVKSSFQPVIVDKNKNNLEPDFLIGNGSKVKVEVKPYEAGKFGLAAGLGKIMIIDLVEYDGSTADFDDVEDEFGVEE